MVAAASARRCLLLPPRKLEWAPLRPGPPANEPVLEAGKAASSAPTTKLALACFLTFMSSGMRSVYATASYVFTLATAGVWHSEFIVLSIEVCWLELLELDALVVAFSEPVPIRPSIALYICVATLLLDEMY